jgi:hypothetical protein
MWHNDPRNAQNPTASHVVMNSLVVPAQENEGLWALCPETIKHQSMGKLSSVATFQLIVFQL